MDEVIIPVEFMIDYDSIEGTTERFPDYLND